ncbi:MAG: type VI secretion system tip protein VgrG [Deltaproteobacteria bacterium]|nr:type VI secretion system tip protein VgrG [Deltaproteobacteria bacterium]
MYTQENRLIAIETPLGPDILLLGEFSGTESVSRLFSYRLTLLSENHRIAFADIIGRNVTLSINLNSGRKRFINGIVASFSQSSSGTERIETGTFSQYTATIVPWPWLLTRTSDIRIFQELSVPDIIEKIFREKGLNDFSLRLHGQYERKVYCVQYRETDFNFVSRLMEEEGIFYFFEHESGKHTFVLADSPAEHPPCPEQETARYFRTEGAFLDQDVIKALEVQQEIRVGKFTLNDYNFETPTTKLTVEAGSRVELGPGEREIYDYPAEYERRAQGDRIADLFMESEEARITSIFGSSDCRAFRTGYRFDLQDYFREDMNDKSYVLMEISHLASSNAAGTGNEVASTYSNNFTCIPHETPFRPRRMTAKPIVEGVQTAVVVGPSGEEIHTDKYGRVKVQFHWDREGKYDENSSCWIRVRQTSAGPAWGSIYVPRIGQEVIVEFMEGDPDRPIITGCMFNGANSPPFALPGGKMISGWKSNSTPGGGGYNEISLNDTRGNEKITIHGQNDMDTVIEHDQALKVKNNRTSTVDVNDTETTGSNQTITVGANQKLAVGANQAVSVGAAQSLSVGAGQTVTVGAGQAITVGGSQTMNVGGSQAVTAAGNQSLSTGSNQTIQAGGIQKVLVGGTRSVTVGGSDSVEVGSSRSVNAAGPITITSGSSITLKVGGSAIKISAGSIDITSGGPISITGGVVKVNS